MSKVKQRNGRGLKPKKVFIYQGEQGGWWVQVVDHFLAQTIPVNSKQEALNMVRDLQSQGYYRV